MNFFNIGKGASWNTILFVFVAQAIVFQFVLAARKIEISEKKEIPKGEGSTQSDSGYDGGGTVNRRSTSSSGIVSRLNLGANTGVRAEDSLLSVQGNKKKKYTETYKGFKVYNTGLDVEEEPDGSEAIVSGDVYADIESDLGTIDYCRLPKNVGKKIALSQFDLAVADVMIVREHYEEYVFVDETNKARWSLDVELSLFDSDGNFVRPVVFLDACTREVLDFFDRSGFYTLPPPDAENTDGCWYTDQPATSAVDNVDEQSKRELTLGLLKGALGVMQERDDAVEKRSYDSVTDGPDWHTNYGTDSDEGSFTDWVTDPPGESNTDSVTDGVTPPPYDSDPVTDSGSKQTANPPTNKPTNPPTVKPPTKSPTNQPPKGACDVVDRCGNPKREVRFGPGESFCLGPMRRSTDGTICYLENEYVKTVDLKNKRDDDSTKIASFECSKGYDDEKNGGYSPVLDAFFFTTASMRIYRVWYDYVALSDPIPYAKAHFGQNYVNAYWDGTSMVFGDGDGTETYPLTNLDTVAHELAHGVTEKTSNLIYRGQSGGINEAFSDMAGEAAEEFLFGRSDWVSGAEMFIKPKTALRYFDDPTKDGYSIKHVNAFRANMDVHYSSGIFNHVFYRVGKAIGIKGSFNCFLAANRLYWRSDTTFETGACGVLRGAYDGGYDMDVVATAFKAVGVTLRDCPDPSSLVTAELQSGVEQRNLIVSDIIQPLFKIRVPTGTIRVTVTSSDGLNVILSNTYKRDDTYLATGSGAVTAEVNGGRTIYARFFRGSMGRIAGASATLSFD